MFERPDKLVLEEPASSMGNLRRLSPLHLSQLPFSSTLSIEPLIEHWSELAESGSPVSGLAADVWSYFDDHPHLRGDLDDPVVLKGHEEFLDLIMVPLFPPAFRDRDPAAALVPFEYRSFYASPAFKKLFTQESGMISGRVNMNLRTFTYGKIITAYLHVLRAVYGVDASFEYPVTFTTQDPATDLDLHFKIVTDLSFVRIRQRGKAPELSDETKRSLLSNYSDLSDWMAVIPPDAFEFYGFSVIRAYDVTDEHMIGLLERDLVQEENLVNRTSLPDVEDHVRTLLRMPQLELGLAAIDGNEFYLLNEPSQPLVDTFFTRSARYDIDALEGSIFELCLQNQTIHVVEDLQRLSNRSRIEDDMLRWGVRNMIAAPLRAQNEQVGVLYIWATEPASLSALNILKLLDVLPIFSAAVKRAREEMRNRVQNVIMGQYTAIHPTVEWRFRQAAVNYIQKQERGEQLEVEPIVFENVYPLFAATDIRASSEHRNVAVQHDLLDHLQLAHDLLQRARDVQPLAMFHHLLARSSRYRASLERGLSSSDEAAVRDFLQTDLEPILLNLTGLSASLNEAIDRYRRAGDPRDGTLYRRSRAFERSVRQINESIATYLDEEQPEIQALVPHYFEKHQTDGIDFSIYAGASLLEEGQFRPSHVHVLRLWQLMVMCGIVLRVELLKERLDVPLETTHLMLVQNTPINIRYRFDESRFDVDGPHHVRFEIMKQRVEKACIKGTSERLTQPDRIAIVYSQEREAREYAAYLEYLQLAGVISPEIESLELDDLQGMKGLRALRMKVAEAAVPKIEPLRLWKAVESLSLR